MSTRTPDSTAYYAARAGEYDEVYEKPERQEDLAYLRTRVPELFAGRRVLEVACGTGYWTQLIARTARHVLATDATPEVLALAGAKTYPGRVQFARADAFRLQTETASLAAASPTGAEGFDAALAAFWCSHVLFEDLPRFFEELHGCLRAGARVVLLDNTFAPGSSTPISATDAEQNTIQRRTLRDGRSFDVVKNFLREDQVRSAAGPRVCEWRFEGLEYYWLASYAIG